MIELAPLLWPGIEDDLQQGGPLGGCTADGSQADGAEQGHQGIFEPAQQALLPALALQSRELGLLGRELGLDLVEQLIANLRQGLFEGAAQIRRGSRQGSEGADQVCL